MRFLDLFAGIGGFRLGMERAGHICVGHCEKDPFAIKSYNAIHQPKEEEWSATDITEVSDEEWRGLRGTVDVICAGFPCQAFSIAGRRGGFSDTRGTMFFEVARAAKQIQPRFLFLENVKGLLSHDKGQTFATILATLDELGYDAEWQVLNSKNFGVPQNRERVFIIGHLRGECGREIFPLGSDGSVLDVSNESNESQSQTELCTTTGTRFGSRANDTLIVQRSRGNNQGGVHDISTTLTTNSFQDNNFVIQVGNIVENKDTFGGNPQRGRVYSPDGISPCISTMQGGGQPKIVYGLYTNVSDDFYRPPLQNLSRTLKANNHDSGVMNVLSNEIYIRKLTPKECWRLQGFPDWAFDRAKATGMSDTQLYKQAGNSVTVNVIEEIAMKLKEVNYGDTVQLCSIETWR